MRENLLLKFFPVPKYLSRPAVGFDISDRSIKFMELTTDGQNLSLGRFGEREIPAGVVEGGELKDVNQFVLILQELKNKFGLENIFMSLPDDKAYTVNLVLPLMKLSEIRGSIELQLEEYIPLPVSEVVFDYDLVPPIKAGAKLEAGVFVLPRAIVQPYLDVFSRVGLNILAIETQSEALARALVPTESHSTLAIVDIGRSHTATFLLKNGVVTAAAAVPVGGEAVTTSLQKNLKIDFAHAEELKNAQGLSRSANNHDAFFATILVVSAIKDEIERRVGFWLEYKEEGDLTTARPQALDQIILCGGQSVLPGFTEYLEIHLHHPVVLGNPWLKVFPAGLVVSQLKFNEALRFSTAIGLALRNFTKIN
ncbi:MAG: type IV pilus assembly protein PilM [Candidatus Paceibacterota bacterium]|jgi:type IV pilus assembly protein PilM